VDIRALSPLDSNAYQALRLRGLRETAAVALYKKLGFVEYGLEHDYLLVNGVLQDEYQMVCRVASFRSPSADLFAQPR
jgi:hypothetical protein